MPIPAAAIPALISGGVQLAQGIGNWFATRHQVKEQRSEYNRMLEYNSPKAQMQRYREAGLSPYLIYGQGNPGNASQPAPADAVIPERVGQNSLAEYMSAIQFSEDIKAKRLTNAILANDVNRSHWRNLNEGLKSTRNSLELLTDFPDYSKREHDGKYYDTDVTNSFRRQINQLKVAASQASIDRVREAIRGMSSENIVKGVKAHYASEYGMVGGDWTQGLGLLKSLPSFFKSRAKNPVSLPSLPRQSRVRYNSPTSWRNLGY